MSNLIIFNDPYKVMEHRKHSTNRAIIVGIDEKAGEVLHRLQDAKIPVYCCLQLENKAVTTSSNKVEVLTIVQLQALKKPFDFYLAGSYETRKDVTIKLLRYQLSGTVFMCYWLEGFLLNRRGILYDDIYEKEVIYDLMGWYKTIPDHFRSVYDNVACLDQTYIGQIYQKPMAYVRKMRIQMLDYHSDYFNIVHGRRHTVGNPDDTQINLYVFGTCHVLGTGAEDKDTICSILQKKWSSAHETNVKVHNFGMYGETIWEARKKLDIISLKKGDAVVFIDIRLDCKSPQKYSIPYGDRTTASVLLVELYKELDLHCEKVGVSFFAFHVNNVYEVKKPSEIEQKLKLYTQLDGLYEHVFEISYDQQMVLHLGRTYGLKLFDMYEWIQRPHSYGEIYTSRRHFGPNGYRMIADHLYCTLQAQWIERPQPQKETADLRETITRLETEYYTQFANKLQQSLQEDSLLRQFRNISKQKPDIAGVIVMNCNPFTLGHLYLVTEALKTVDCLYVMIVQEDVSYFTFNERIELARKALYQYSNVEVIPSGRRLASSYSFPEYFEKDKNPTAIIDASMDIDIFCNEIAPALHVKKRFVGDEPYCPITRQYHEQMMEALPAQGIEFVIIKRIEIGGKAISASQVRKLYEKGDFEGLKHLVPPTTYEYLMSRKKQPIPSSK